MQTSSHWLIGTATATAPPTARMTKPAAIARTSRMTRCFRKRLYAPSSPTNTTATTPRFQLSANDATSDVPPSTIAPATAPPVDSVPDAIGRFRLVGCRRSSWRSTRSLTRYIALDRPQKIANAQSAAPKACASSRRWPKIRPAKTMTFFVHWSGRREIASAATGCLIDTSPVDEPSLALWV